MAGVTASMDAEQLPLTVDLDAQEIRFHDGRALPFGIDPHRRRTRIEGLDEIGLFLADISDFEAGSGRSVPGCTRRGTSWPSSTI